MLIPRSLWTRDATIPSNGFVAELRTGDWGQAFNAAFILGREFAPAGELTR